MSGPLEMLSARGVTPVGITADSRQVRPGSLFVAYPGAQRDGRDYIGQAVSQGACAVLWEPEGYHWDERLQVPNLAVSGLRAAAGDIADRFYGEPSRALWMIGVTGTNGKTSCSQWLAQALNILGRKTAVVGTLGNGFPGALSAAINTTPDPILLQGMLADYLEQGASGVAMEVSSHGLDQGRVNGVHFDVAVFTNLSRDHLDYHGDIASYAAAKRKLFVWPGLAHAVVNSDDAFGRELADQLAFAGKPVLTYGLDSGDVRASALVFNDRGLSMRIDSPFGAAKLEAGVAGRFNAYNLLAVLSTLLVSGVPLAQVVAAMAELRAVPGRMQQAGGGALPLVVVDYAHTPDALEKVLQALRTQTRGQLICVFGCGGDRDAGKRPLMGQIVGQLADRALVTSDNPRSEDPQAIIKAIVADMTGDYHIEPDRAVAITEAILNAGPGDVVLVAGKGHEAYQEVAGVRYPFSDLDVAERALQQHKRRPA
ncbi:MAG TPA: UDP-N-acetylmuramoyl-L-alanyl-D-glutamate--2,6-diaminopimelate ligase [Methylophilaceae bacterium]|nr:UDP-N-acetylmuramoyl-L-alanyl-D-glutamate--2,6-diaminopimelate ligase [Methylophilaceae bacterium]